VKLHTDVILIVRQYYARIPGFSSGSDQCPKFLIFIFSPVLIDWSFSIGPFVKINKNIFSSKSRLNLSQTEYEHPTSDTGSDEPLV
jgi:hypothetical protein